MRPEVDASFAAALRRPHTLAVRVEAWLGSTMVSDATDGLPIRGGEVKLDATAKVRRQVSVELPASRALEDLLSVPGTQLRAFRGITYPGGGSTLVPLGRFDVDTSRVDYSPSGNLSVSGGDYWGRVQAADFLLPGVANFGTLITTQIVQFLQEALPFVSVTNQITTSYVAGSKVWEEDRAGAITEMVDAIGAELFFDAVGTAVLRPLPGLAASSVWTVDVGSDGVLMDATRELSNTDTRNVVMVTAAAVDGVAPFEPVYVWDNTPSSPTYAGPDPVSNPGAAGPFGVRVARLSSPLITSFDQAIAAGNARLAQLSGVSRRLSLTSAVNPGLEPGDTISVQLPNRSVEAHLVDTVTIPLTPDGTQQISTRAYGGGS